MRNASHFLHRRRPSGVSFCDLGLTSVEASLGLTSVEASLHMTSVEASSAGIYTLGLGATGFEPLCCFDSFFRFSRPPIKATKKGHQDSIYDHSKVV